MNIKLQQESEFDKNISTLANVQGKCRFYRLKGICKAGDCNHCQTKQAYDKCYDAMALCDRLAVDDKAAGVYYNLKHHYAAAMRNDKMIGGLTFYVVVMLVFALIAII